MFSLFKKDPAKELKKKYMLKLEQGMNAQRNGDIRTYSEISLEAETILKELDALESKNKN